MIPWGKRRGSAVFVFFLSFRCSSRLTSSRLAIFHRAIWELDLAQKGREMDGLGILIVVFLRKNWQGS